MMDPRSERLEAEGGQNFKGERVFMYLFVPQFKDSDTTPEFQEVI